MVAVTGACHGLLSGQSEVTARIKSRRINLRQSLFLEFAERKQGTYKFEEMSVA